MKKQVFLGGTCGETTWRRDIAIPLLQAAGISWHNPQIGLGEWTAEYEATDMQSKADAEVLLFVISAATRGIAAIAEVAYLLAAGRPLALAVEDIPEHGLMDRQPVTRWERDDLNRGRLFVRTMAQSHHVPVFDQIADATRYAIQLVRDRQPIVNIEGLRSLLAEVRHDPFEFRTEVIADGFTIQLAAEIPDVDTGVRSLQVGRKWFLPCGVLRNDVVRTAFQAVFHWMEHEARERFTYRGAKVFGPHLDVEQLAAICREKAQ